MTSEDADAAICRLAHRVIGDPASLTSEEILRLARYILDNPPLCVSHQD